jgi:hypothetical protein
VTLIVGVVPVIVAVVVMVLLKTVPLLVTVVKWQNPHKVVQTNGVSVNGIVKLIEGRVATMDSQPGQNTLQSGNGL